METIIDFIHDVLKDYNIEYFPSASTNQTGVYPDFRRFRQVVGVAEAPVNPDMDIEEAPAAEPVTQEELDQRCEDSLKLAAINFFNFDMDSNSAPVWLVRAIASFTNDAALDRERSPSQRYFRRILGSFDWSLYSHRVRWCDLGCLQLG